MLRSRLGDVLEPRSGDQRGRRRRAPKSASGEGILVSSATVADGSRSALAQGVWRDRGGYGSRSGGARSAGARSRVRGVESRFPMAPISLCRRWTDLSTSDGSFRSVRFACHVALRPWLWGTYDCIGAEQRQSEPGSVRAIESYLDRESVSRASCGSPLNRIQNRACGAPRDVIGRRGSYSIVKQ